VRNGTGTTFDPYSVDIKACSNNEVLKYNTTSSTWDCGADNGAGTEVDGVIGNEILNATSGGGLARSGTGTNIDPYTLAIATGGITTNMFADGSITSAKIADGGIALVDLGANSVDSSKILDGSIALVDLASNSVNSSKIVDGSITGSDIANGTITNANLINSSLTIVSGSGLINGGTVSLGGTTTLNIGAGNGINVNADDIGVRTTVATDALSNTTSSGSGLEVLASGVTLLQGCSDGQILKWNETSDVWACNTDNGNSLSVGTIDSVTKSANGATISGNNIILQTADATNPGLVSTGTQTFDGDKTFSGNVNLNTFDGAGLTSCSGSSSKLLYDSATKKFVCGTDSASLAIVKAADQSVTNTTTLVDDNDFNVAIGANETYILQFEINVQSPTAADIAYKLNAPAGSSCHVDYNSSSAGGVTYGNLGCNTLSGKVPTSGNNTDTVHFIYASITTGATAGNVTLQWAQSATNDGATIVKKGSQLLGFKVSGADLAEIYYAKDYSINAGDLVSLSGEGVSQVEKSENSKRENIIGVVSTKPGQVLGEADGQGKPVPIALTGRVPVKITTENGEIKAGDQITVSSTKVGYGAKAITSGRVVGKALADATPDDMVTVFVEPGYWQAPLNFDLSSIFTDDSDALSMNTAESFVDTSTEVKEAVIKNLTSSKQFNSVNQDLVDQVQKGFKTQQDQIKDLNKEIENLKSSDSAILKQIGDQVQNGENTNKATENVTGVRLVEGSGFEYIKNLEAIKSGDQIKVSQGGKAVDYNSVVGYLVQTVQDQQIQLDSLGKSDKVNGSTGLSIDLESFKESFLGQITEIKVRLDLIEKTNDNQDVKLNKLEQENEDLKTRLDNIGKKLN
jgi:hypothetical protein